MKRFVSICFVILLLLSFATPVCAADALTVVEITGLTLPVEGATPDMSASVLQEECRVTAVKWMDLWTDQYISASDRFIYEKDEYGNERYYRLEIHIEITDRYTVIGDPTNTYFTVNGRDAWGHKEDDYHFVVEIDLLPTGHTCSGGYATCVAPANCSVCGKPYGAPNPENHDIFGYPKAASDPKLQTHHDMKCDLCQKLLGEEAHEFGEPDHNEALPCIICWYRLPKGEGANKPATPSVNPATPAPTEHTHKGGTATCEKGPICTTCGKEYGKPDESKHELVAVKKEENDGKLTTHHDLRCEVCQKTVSEEEHTLGPENHMGVKPCIICWYTPKVEVQPHECTGGTATCCEKAYCSICGEPYGEFDKTAHTYLDSWGYTDEKSHAKNCIACGETGMYEEHIPSEEDPDICSECGYPIQKDSGMSTGQVVAIAAGSTAATGGAAAGAVYVYRKKRIK